MISRVKDMADDDPTWYGFDDLRLPNRIEHQGILALRLTADDWETLLYSALELRWFSDGMQRAFAPGGKYEGKLNSPHESGLLRYGPFAATSERPRQDSNLRPAD